MRTVTMQSAHAGMTGAASQPQLFLVLDGSHPLAGSLRVSLADVTRLSVGRGAERRLAATAEGTRLDVPDAWLSGSHFFLERTAGHWVIADKGSKNGTFVNGAPVAEAVLDDGDLIFAGAHVFLFRYRPLSADTGAVAKMLSTHVAELAQRFLELERAAKSTIPILIGGETGTGKEVIAKTIHELSKRSGPFVAINCGALPRNLIEAELFGAKKGAFSGADADRPGLVKTADKGTLFLDEIAELPLDSQATLLRVLQEREVMPLGGNKPVAVDLRVIAATHQDLDVKVDNGSFRSDLYARLLGFDIDLLPLRERIEDLGDLLARLLPRRADGTTATLHPEVARALCVYDWPLNIRELARALETAHTVSDGATIELRHLPQPVRTSGARPKPQTRGRAEVARANSAEEISALHANLGGNISAMARALGTSRSQVRRLLERHGIAPGGPE
jgi:DNA-binding NtrC family response regulator